MSAVVSIQSQAAELCAAVAQLVSRGLGAHACVVWELVPAGGVLVLRAATGPDAALVDTLALPLESTSPERDALRSNQTIIVDDLEDASRFAVRRQHSYRSAASAVIAGEAHPFGVMTALHSEPSAFDPDDARFLDWASALLAAALRGARRTPARHPEVVTRLRAVEQAAPFIHGPHHARVRFTPREREVLALIAQGLTNGAIAARLGVSVTTVRTHVRGIIEKLGVNSKLQAIVRVTQQGMLHD